MEVDIVRSSPQARIYLQQMKDFPGKDRFDLALPARIAASGKILRREVGSGAYAAYFTL